MRKYSIMNYDTITLEIENDVALITLNRPDVMNSLSMQMRAEIPDAMIEAQLNARVIVMTGAGNAFCSGQDLGADTDLANIDLERILRDEYAPMLEVICNSKIPTIAAVNGVAAGAGANLALAMDVCIASYRAYFVQSMPRIGLMPDAGGTYFLPRKIGLARAMGAALFADRIPAYKAADMGLIYEAVNDADFEAHWQSRALQLAQGPTVAYRNIKQALRTSSGNTLDEQFELEAELQDECGQSRDFKEGVTAFLNGRPAKFEGR